MIRSENGNMVAKGAENSILADLTTIIRGLVDYGFSKDRIKAIVELGLKTDDEIEQIYKACVRQQENSERDSKSIMDMIFG